MLTTRFTLILLGILSVVGCGPSKGGHKDDSPPVPPISPPPLSQPTEKVACFAATLSGKALAKETKFLDAIDVALFGADSDQRNAVISGLEANGWNCKS